MLLEKIILEGFLSYRKRQEIDLSDVLTCLVLGRINDDVELSNGAGKSSLFEAIPVNFFGKGSGRADLLDSYINDNMSKMYIEVIFKIDNQRFKSIRSKSRNTGALFEIFLDTTNQDLKNATWKKTDKTIEEILGLGAKTYSSTIYLNERESLQIITGTSSERKEILRELLNIELYEKAARFCTKKFDDLDKKVQVNLNIVQDKQKQLEQEEEIKQSFKDTELTLKKVKRDLKSKEKEFKDLNDEKQKLNTQIETENLIKNQIIQGNRELGELAKQGKLIIDEIHSLIEESKSQTKLYEQRKKALEDSLEEKATIKKSIKTQEEILEELDQVDKNLKAFQARRKDLEDHASELEKTIAVLKTEQKPLQNSLAKINEFKNICPVTDLECALLKGDFKDKFKTELLKELEVLQNKINENQDQHQKLTQAIKSMLKEQTDLEIKASTRQLQNNKLSKLKLSLQTIENSETTFKEKEKEFKQYLKEVEIDKSKLSGESQEVQEKIEEKRKIVVELETKLNPELQRILSELTKSVEDVEDEIGVLRAEIDDVNQEIGELKNKIDGFEKMKADIEHFLKINEENTKQKKIHQTLSMIFGKDGVQKSIMKESIPMLEKYTMEFLKIFNEDSEKIKVKFDLDPKRQDGELKKGGGLDILVLEEGKDPKDLQMYSGGETVRIVFSIVLSLAKLLSLRAGKKHETLIIDEKIAKLDVRGISQFGEVIQEIAKIYKQVFVITHIETLKDMINGNEIIVNKTDDEGSLVTVS
ncbi:MAG: hypothetical protein PHF86_07805 [Candidatus Nanoarchaeia archaeon]|jgi:exonuclease SbcC|nr:hypothetical protein [Candidatus Nanoarchaeia archaeon]